jgi:hypothetical protein
MNKITSLLLTALRLATPFCILTASATNSRTPLADAVAVWHMDDGGDAVGKNAAVTLHGDVKLGVELAGTERKASLARGGAGKVAEFNGGYMVAAAGRLSSLNGSKTMTLCMRLRDSGGAWNSPLLSLADPAEKFPGLLYGAQLDRTQIGFRESLRIRQGAKLEFLWRTNRKGIGPGSWSHPPDFTNGVLRVGVPVDLINPADWHDVIVRFTGPRLEMFVDGVLVDEEWPYGAIDGMNGSILIGAGFENGKLKTGFRGQVDHVAIWNRAITDDEIAALSGGAKEMARREIEILGAENPDAQYWRPRGYNAFVGDVMLFFHEGRLHVFYLYDRRHHRSKWGVGAHQFAHLSSKDLVHWEEHPMALSITDQTECSLGTGSFVFRDGIYYLYYIHHAQRLTLADAPYPGDNIFMATSKDGIHFTKNPKPVAIMNQTGGDINPHVITAESGDRFIMNVAGYRVYTSDNLLDWKEANMPQFSIGWGCTDDFRWNSWRYFTGGGKYVMSRDPIEDTQDWTIPASSALSDWVGAPVVSEFTGNRFIYAGFVGGSYAEELVFRELVQEKDGALGMKWPEEMIPTSGNALQLAWKPLKGDVSIDNSSVRLGAKDGLASAMLADVPQNVRITLRAKPRAGTLNFGLRARGAGDDERGCELRFDPANQRLQYRDGPALDKVPGLDQAFTIDLIVKDDLVDVCVGNRRTLINRHSANGDRLLLFVRNGEVTFDDIKVRPLLSRPKPRNFQSIPGRRMQ